jgi:hypothetical protein
MANIIQLPYREYVGGLAPIISLKVLAGHGGHRWRRLWAYVDSGAAYSVVTVSEAKRLGLLKIKAARHLAVTTSGGRTQRISLHRLWVKVGGDRRISITFGVPRDFDVAFNLLGRRDFFRHYQVCFDDVKAVINLTRNAPVRRRRR